MDRYGASAQWALSAERREALLRAGPRNFPNQISASIIIKCVLYRAKIEANLYYVGIEEWRGMFSGTDQKQLSMSAMLYRQQSARKRERKWRLGRHLYSMRRRRLIRRKGRNKMSAKPRRRGRRISFGWDRLSSSVSSVNKKRKKKGKK
jgi:hypothetical protein